MRKLHINENENENVIHWSADRTTLRQRIYHRHFGMSSFVNFRADEAFISICR
jgi:hypothetical protein